MNKYYGELIWKFNEWELINLISQGCDDSIIIFSHHPYHGYTNIDKLNWSLGTNTWIINRSFKENVDKDFLSLEQNTINPYSAKMHPFVFDFNEWSENNMFWHQTTGSQEFRYLLIHKILFRSEGNPNWYNFFKFAKGGEIDMV